MVEQINEYNKNRKNKKLLLEIAVSEKNKYRF